MIDRVVLTRAVRSRDQVDELRLSEVLEWHHGVLFGRGLESATVRLILEQYALDWHDARLEREALIGRWDA